MPYYRWQGITLAGDLRSGYMFARSETALQKRLLHEAIGCTHVRIIGLFSFLSPFTLERKAELLRQWATLLYAGVHLRDALRISAHATTHKYSKLLLEDCAQALEEGMSLSQVLSYYPEFCTNFMVAVIAASEKAADVACGLEKLSTNILVLSQFRQRIRAALVMPGLTFCFFICLVLGFLLLLVPRFELFFEQFKAPLPAITAGLVWLSKQLSFLCIVIIISIFSIFSYVIYKVCVVYKNRLLVLLVTRVPGIKAAYKLVATAYFLHLMDLLLSGNIQLAQALRITAGSTRSYVLCQALEKLAHDVESGMKLCAALQSNSLFSCNYLEALVAIGENSGNIQVVIHHAAGIYQAILYKRLAILATLVQPVMLVILGILIAGLLIALYLPLISLSHAF